MQRLPQIQYLRFPLIVKWYITGKCNLRCTHCYLTDYTKQIPYEKIITIVDYLASKGVSQILFLGGEPFVRKDLDEIVARVVSHKLATQIATNGILITKERASSIVSAGCRHFQVSLEGHSPETNDPVRGHKTFHKAMTGAQNLREQNAFVRLALTVSKRNAPFISQMIQVAKDAGVQELRLAAFVPLGTGSLTKDFLLDEKSIEVIKEGLARHLQNKNGLNIDCSFLDAQPQLSCSTFGCGAGTTNLIINSDLSLSACDLLVEEDRTKISVNSPNDIEKLWQEHPLFRKWRGIDPHAQTKSIKSFSGVHMSRCHVAKESYAFNISQGFSREYL